LPLMIILNLFFGLLFFKPATWFLVGGILVLLFMINSYLLVKKMKNLSTKKGKIIDIEARVLEKED